MLDETKKTINNKHNHVEPLDDGKLVEKIDKRDMLQLNDPACLHENITTTKSLEIEGALDVHCNDCHMGKLLLPK